MILQTVKRHFNVDIRMLYISAMDHARKLKLKGELTKFFYFCFFLDQVSLISLLKYFPPKMSLT